MSPESMPQISLGAAALGLFLICIGFIFFRGIVRMFFGALILCGSAWVGFTVWEKAPTWAIEWTGKPVAWLTTGLPIVAFIATFLLARLVIGFFLKPFQGDGKPRAGFFASVFSAIIPTALLWLTGATLVHHFGSIAEIGAAFHQPGVEEKQTPLLAKARELKDAIAKIIPAEWLQKLDPLADPSHLSLAKLLAAQPKHVLKPVIDPATHKPYPRAVIVDEPELQDLASDGRFSTLLRHPLFQKALNDPRVQKALQEQMKVK